MIPYFFNFYTENFLKYRIVIILSLLSFSIQPVNASWLSDATGVDINISKPTKPQVSVSKPKPVKVIKKVAEVVEDVGEATGDSIETTVSATGDVIEASGNLAEATINTAEAVVHIAVLDK